MTLGGRVMQEYLLQRATLKTKDSLTQEWKSEVLLGDLALLSLSKRSTNHFQAACSFFPLPRRLGHRGVLLQHLAADRAVVGPLSLLMNQRA